MDSPVTNIARTGPLAPALREARRAGKPLRFMGIYDVFSASIAGRHHDTLFVSGFGFAASHYGLPDIGFIAWPDMVEFVRRLRTVLPLHHLLVDIDDGYGDTEVACHVVSLLDHAGVSAVVLEDQRRPRRCGHLDGKQILDLDAYLEKLNRVLDARRNLLVVARTDAVEPQEILRRVHAFADAGADVVLADGIRDLELVRQLSREIDRPVAFNQIAGGKSMPCTTGELAAAGVALVIYSTPCLFAAQEAIEQAMRQLSAADGRLPVGPDRAGVKSCTTILEDNLARRDRAGPAVTISGEDGATVVPKP